MLCVSYFFALFIDVPIYHLYLHTVTYLAPSHYLHLEPSPTKNYSYSSKILETELQSLNIIRVFHRNFLDLGYTSLASMENEGISPNLQTLISHLQDLESRIIQQLNALNNHEIVLLFWVIPF